MIKADVDKSAVGTIGHKLKGAAAGLRDFRAAFKEAKPDVAAGFDAIFQSEGGAIGQRWPSLSKTYTARKKRGGLLERSGKLRRSFTSRISARIAKKTARYGSSVRYAGAVTWGSPKQGIPPRIVALWPSTSENAVVRRVEAYTAELTRGK